MAACSGDSSPSVCPQYFDMPANPSRSINSRACRSSASRPAIVNRKLVTGLPSRNRFSTATNPAPSNRFACADKFPSVKQVRSRNLTNSATPSTASAVSIRNRPAFATSESNTIQRVIGHPAPRTQT